MFKQFKSVHLFLGVLVAFWLAFLAVSGVAWWGMSRSADSLHELHQVRMQRSDQLNALARQILVTRLEVLLLFQHDPNGSLHSAHGHPATLHLDRSAEQREGLLAAWKGLQGGPRDPEETAELQRAEDATRLWLADLETAVAAARAGNYADQVMLSFLKAGREHGEPLLQSLLAAAAHQNRLAGAAAEQADARHSLAMGVLAALALLFGVPGTAITALMLRRLRLGFAQADAAARAIAEGHLGHRIAADGQDEIGQLLARMHGMQQQLVLLIQRVRQASDSIEVAATEVAAGNVDLSRRTEQTAATLQQTASSAEELGTTVQHNADNAGHANQLSADASKLAIRGGEVVTQMVGTMREIDARSKRIADIIGVIDGIAFQTNILALNAAVEAARAGEAGRGFAVVASEVRALAQRSAAAAREIKQLIQASVAQVDLGTAQADQAGLTMTEVVGAIQRVSEIMAAISLASREQSSGVALVGQAVGQMDQATQQNAALVEQSAAAAESLREQARQLVQVVGTFRM